jgi:multiple antibiotic resistance protein
VIDPLGSVPVYLEATNHFDKKHKRKIAINASITGFGVLFFIIVGQFIPEGNRYNLRFTFNIEHHSKKSW